MFSSCRGSLIQPVNVLESINIMPAKSRAILLLALIVAAPIAHPGTDIDTYGDIGKPFAPLVRRSFGSGV